MIIDYFEWKSNKYWLPNSPISQQLFLSVTSLIAISRMLTVQFSKFSLYCILYWFTTLHVCLLAYLPNRLFPILLVCPLAHLRTCSSAHLLICSLAHMPICWFAHLLICVLAHLLTCSFAYLLICLLTHLSTHLSRLTGQPTDTMRHRNGWK